jgi:EAL domain-containing protein (putative c-di-GMP-specific phosphodiesterase class I)
MLSLHPDQELDRIAAGLADSGALALLLIDAAPLERIERRYGGEAYRESLDNLMGLVRELAEETLSGEQVLITEERSRGAILAFLFCPRSNDHFYGEILDELSSRISNELRSKGRRAVYPYHKGPLELSVGAAVVLHNPTIKAERQILQAVEDAREDAQLELGLKTRLQSRQLLQVILAGQIQIRYEAIVDLNNAQVFGYEALSRGPEGTDLNRPVELFRRAEGLGLLYELDCLCRRLALEGAHRLPKDTTIFLNCLPTAIGDPALRHDGLRKTLENFDLRPSNLVLEISESESIENFNAFREVVDTCRELGIRIAMDDAGTGYASLEAIMKLEPDFIKTDMLLVRGIDSDPSRQEIVRAMEAVARGIGAQVVAEGIETEPELSALRDIGIRLGQGFYFGASSRGASS